MRRLTVIVAALGLAATSSSATPAIRIVNGTEAPLGKLEIRPVGRSWQTLFPGLSPGARTSVDLPAGECAFDIRATVAGGQAVTWNRLNLCEARSVTLNRRADGTSWVDYD